MSKSEDRNEQSYLNPVIQTLPTTAENSLGFDLLDTVLSIAQEETHKFIHNTAVFMGVSYLAATQLLKILNEERLDVKETAHATLGIDALDFKIAVDPSSFEPVENK